jgi:hypothetical protein
MASPSNTFSTPTAIGNREDLSDIIYRIDPTETPFVSGVSRETATAVNHEWQTQALASPNGSNYQLEGDDIVADAATPTVRLGNIAQISRKAAQVSGTQQAVIHAGRGNELDYQVMLKGLELKRDLETIVLSNQAKSSSDPRKTASVLSFIKTNTSKGVAGGAADPVAADGTGTRTDGTQLAFTENRMKTVLSAIWVAGGKPNVIMTGAFNKQAFSTFTGRSSPIEQAASKTIVAAVDAYESDFGKIKVVPNRFQRTRDVLILEMQKWALAYVKGRNMVSIPLARTGDSERRAVVTEYAVVARNEKSSGGVFDNTTS